MKKTSALAPSKTDSSFGQPPVTTTGSTPGTWERHFASSLQPALNSWAPGPWLGLPAISTILFASAARTGRAGITNPRPNAARTGRSFLVMGLLSQTDLESGLRGRIRGEGSDSGFQIRDSRFQIRDSRFQIPGFPDPRILGPQRLRVRGS